MTTPESPPEYYWFYQGDHRVLVVAVGFGLGPRVAAENLLLDLKVIEDREIEWHKQGLADMAGLIEVSLLLNFGVISELPDFQPKQRVWIDCVDWLRTTLPPHIKGYDLLLREAFFPSAPDGDKGDITKWHDVQPLIPSLARDKHPDADLILLSFGGVATPYSTDVHTIKMPLAFLCGVKQCLDALAHKRVVAFLPKNLLKRCQGNKKVSHAHLELCELERTAFMDAMKRCGLLICQPGLYTPFEAMKMGVPFALTYPMSFTQDQQGAKFLEMGVECFECDWATHNKISGTPSDDIETIEKAWFADSAIDWKKTKAASLSNKVELWLRNLNEENRPRYPRNDKKMAVSLVKKILGKNKFTNRASLFAPKPRPTDPVQEDISLITDRNMLEKAITELKRCVSNGLFQQAAELTDQLMEFCLPLLKQPDNIDLLVAIKVERLKRLDYLGFDKVVQKSSEELLNIFKTKTNKKVLKDNLGKLDFVATQFVIVGQPLWKVTDVSCLKSGIEKCAMLLGELPPTDIQRLFCFAFLCGLRGRLAGLEGHWAKVDVPLKNGVQLFEQGCQVFTCLPKKLESSYPHLLAYFIENAMEFDDIDTATKITEKFYFSTLRKTTSNGDSAVTPQKMHVRLRVQLAEYKRSIGKQASKVTQNKYARECWLTAFFLGLNVRTPLPPLLEELADFAKKHSRKDETRLAHNILIEMFNETDWRGIEQIVALYFEAEGYEVERQFAGAKSFDLIVRRRGLHGEVTATGVQVKHWQKAIAIKDFDQFKNKLYRTEVFKTLTHLLIYCTNGKTHVNVRAAANSVRDWYPNLRSIEFIDAIKLASSLLQSPSVLPAALFYAKTFSKNCSKKTAK